MAWGNEIEAAVYTMVLNLASDNAGLLIQILLIFAVDVVNDWLPTA